VVLFGCRIWKGLFGRSGGCGGCCCKNGFNCDESMYAWGAIVGLRSLAL